MVLTGLKAGTQETDMVPTFLGMRGLKLSTSIGLASSAGFLLFGYDQGVLGSLYTLPSWTSRFPEIDTTNGADASSRAATLQGLVTGVYELGCFVGAIAMLYFGNKLGRRRNIWIGSIIMAVGTIGCTASFNLPMLFVFRVILGIGNGMHTATIPVWQSECSPPHKRGMLLMIEGACITAGICLSYWIDFAFFWLDPNEAAWRVPIALQALLIIPTFATIWLPESPRWLMLRDREEDARQVIASLENVPVDDPVVGKKMKEIQGSLTAAKTAKISDIFTNGPERNFHRTVLAFVIQMFQQISGINLITYYIGQTLQQQLGFSDVVSRIIAACNGTEYFLASLIAIWTIERMGRRKLMLIGAAGQCISMVVLAVMNIPSLRTEKAPGAISVLFYFLFNSFFAFGWLGMTWLYPAEITPLSIRAQANGISTSANWLFNFMVVMCTPIMFQNLQYNTYTVFAVLNFAILVTTFFIFPETSGRSLEEISAIFAHSSKINPYDVVLKEQKLPRRYDTNGQLLNEDFDINEEIHDIEKVPSTEEKKHHGANTANSGTVNATESPSEEGSVSTDHYRRP